MLQQGKGEKGSGKGKDPCCIMEKTTKFVLFGSQKREFHSNTAQDGNAGTACYM